MKYKKKIDTVVEAVEFMEFNTKNGIVLAEETPRWFSVGVEKGLIRPDAANALLVGSDRAMSGDYILIDTFRNLSVISKEKLETEYEPLS